jgi:hypothetical protein
MVTVSMRSQRFSTAKMGLRHPHEVTTFLNSKDGANPPATRMADRVLSTNNMTMRDTLVQIINFFHLLAVVAISHIVINNIAFGKRNHPQHHLSSSKINIISRLITVVTYGKSMNLDSILDCPGGDGRAFAALAVEFVVIRLSSSTFDFTPLVNDLLTAKWTNFKKAINCRAYFGTWSDEYCQHLISFNKVSAVDGAITKGVLFQVVVYCNKKWHGFHAKLDSKPHNMLPTQYKGTLWNSMVGKKLYLEQDASNDSDLNGDDKDGGNNDVG